MGGETLRSAIGVPDHLMRPDGEIPFSLAYGMEAIIPIDMYMPTLRTKEIN